MTPIAPAAGVKWEPSEFLAALLSFCLRCKVERAFSKVAEALSSYQYRDECIPVVTATRFLFRLDLCSEDDDDNDDDDEEEEEEEEESLCGLLPDAPSWQQPITDFFVHGLQ